MQPNEQAILKTLLYSDIFNFPLTKDELWRFLILDKKITKEAFEKALHNLSEFIVAKNGFYCMQGSEQSIVNRKKNLKEVHKKLLIARKAAFYLSFIPTVSFIGISGGLALENGDKDDDIDFFIITKKKTLFMTRLWILGLLEWLNLRRKRNGKTTMDKICVNLLIDETKLTWPTSKRDLYIAHEIVHLKPLFERNNMYEKFIVTNKWVGKFFPNRQEANHILPGKKWRTNYYSLRFINFLFSLFRFEILEKKMQKHYMKKHQTSEVVTNTFLAFHPIDYRSKTMMTLRLKCDKLGLLTNF
jgi:hypothetical protein